MALTCASIAAASDWPHWRGPFLNGSTGEPNLPQSWSLTENVAWVAPLPGPSGATPIVAAGRVFVSSTVKGGNELLAMGFDAKTGRELWRRTVAQTDRRIPNSTLATPSPVTDGRSVFFIYASGHLAAFDLDGNPFWSRNLETDYGNLACQFGYGSSPLIVDGRLFIQVLRRDKAWREPKAGEPFDSFLLALDPMTGRNLWKQVRQTDALNESMDSYASPIPYAHDGKTEILVAGGDYVTAHDLQTGSELWRYGYAPKKDRLWRLVPSLVTGSGLVFGVQPRGGNDLFALKSGGRGPLSAEAVAWTFKGPTPDVPTPLYYRDKLYVLDDVRNGKMVSCLDPATGQVKWQGVIGGGGPWRASLTAGDGKLYCINEDGEAIVLSADQFKILSRVQMNDAPVQSSIAIANNHLFIRTAGKLFCIGR
jgi:outer membrane protein assembly factor BamB